MIRAIQQPDIDIEGATIELIKIAPNADPI
jgi:hypothetical protein